MRSTYRPAEHPRGRDGRFAAKQPKQEPDPDDVGFDDDKPHSMLDATFLLASRVRDGADTDSTLARFTIAQAIASVAALTSQGGIRFDFDDLNPCARAWLDEYRGLCDEQAAGQAPYESEWDDTMERGLALLDSYLERRQLQAQPNPVRCRLCRVLVPASHRTDREGQPVCDNCHERHGAPTTIEEGSIR